MNESAFNKSYFQTRRRAGTETHILKSKQRTPNDKRVVSPHVTENPAADTYWRC